MISSSDSCSDNDDSSLTSSSCLSDSDGEINLTKWTVTPTANRDPFQFIGNPKTRVKEAQTPVEFWNHIFPENLVQLILFETNRYAESICNSSNVRQRYSRINKWEPTNAEEFNIFIALLILQGIIRKPELEMYFTTDELLTTPVFNKIMIADRFQILLKMLHFETNQGADNKLKKILPVIDALRSSFKSLYKPGRFLNVDESLHLYKGRLSWKQWRI